MIVFKWWRDLRPAQRAYYYSLFSVAFSVFALAINLVAARGA